MRKRSSLFPLLLLGLLTACLLPACAEEPPTAAHARAIQPPATPFSVGLAEDYRPAGVYRQFRDRYGIWIVSSGDMVVALHAACPEDGAATRYDSLSNCYRCPSCATRFSTDGLVRRGGVAKTSLARCAVEVRPDGHLIVNAARRFVHERNQWSTMGALHLFRD